MLIVALGDCGERRLLFSQDNVRVPVLCDLFLDFLAGLILGECVRVDGLIEIVVILGSHQNIVLLLEFVVVASHVNLRPTISRRQVGFLFIKQ